METADWQSLQSGTRRHKFHIAAVVMMNAKLQGLIFTLVLLASMVSEGESFFGGGGGGGSIQGKRSSLGQVELVKTLFPPW